MLTQDDLGGLTADQRGAILDLVAAAILGDGVISDAERTWVDQRLVHGVFASAEPGGMLRRLDQGLARYTTDVRDEISHQVYVFDVVARIAARGLGERILAFVLQLARADGEVTAVEQATIRFAAEAFGVGMDRVAALARPSGDALFPACAKGDTAGVRALLDAGAPIDARDDNQWTPLHVAVACGHAEVAAMLVARGAPLEAVNAQGATPLCCACNKPRAEIVALLTRAGANANVRLPADLAPLDLAAQFGQADVIRMLLAGGAKWAASKRGTTPLHHAAEHDCVAGARFLLEAGHDPNAANVDGMTPVHFAAQNQPDTLEVLLGHGGNVHAETTGGARPLQQAARAASQSCARMLLDAGASVDHQSATAGPAAYIASIHRHLDVLDLLVARGANLDLKRPDGDTARAPAGAAKPPPPPTIPWVGEPPPLAGRVQKDFAPKLLAKRWLRPVYLADQAPVAFAGPNGRVWIAILSGDGVLGYFRKMTIERLDWTKVGAIDSQGALFDVSRIACDGVIFDPFTPSHMVFTLEDCAKILEG